MNLVAVLLTGLTTGAITCLAVQGGMLTSIIANQQKTKKRNNDGKKLLISDMLPVGMFLGAKLISHFVLGLLLGLLGSIMTLSLPMKLAFQAFTALFMLASAMNLLQVHPIFRYTMIQTPRFITRRVSKVSRRDELFAPAVLGLVSVLIPCGVTQAMEVLAINSGSALQGGLIMATFVLGTSPLFATIGLATTKFSEIWRDRFLRIAAYLLIAMSLYTINGILQVVDAPISVQKLFSVYQRVKFYESGGVDAAFAPVVAGKQIVNIDVFSGGYSPTYIKVKKGVPVTLTLKSTDAYSCASSFVFREFDIATMLKANDLQTFTFTPTRSGKFSYSCSMGMYSGIMEVQ